MKRLKEKKQSCGIQREFDYKFAKAQKVWKRRDV